MPIQTSNIELQVGDKEVNAYLATPDGGGPGILVLHAWWGLTPFFKQVCERLAAQGFVVLAPDLHHGKMATTIDEAQALVDNGDPQSIGDTMMAAKERLLAQEGLQGRKIGVVGFSFGAAWALVLADRAPEQVAATVLFYGAYSFDFGKLRSKVMGHYSPDDTWEPLEGVQGMQNEMKSAGVETDFHFYPGTKHWFVEDNRPEYDAAAAELAWGRTFAFLKQNL